MFHNKITHFVYKARIYFPRNINEKDITVFIFQELHSLLHFLFLFLFIFFHLFLIYIVLQGFIESYKLPEVFLEQYEGT